MQIRLDGRVALITGGSMGLGKAMAQKFAAAGADVAIVARRPEPLAEAVREISAAGGRCRAYPGDVSKADEVSRVFAAVCADLERVDILVNNVGASRDQLLEELRTLVDKFPDDAALNSYLDLTDSMQLSRRK